MLRLTMQVLAFVAALGTPACGDPGSGASDPGDPPQGLDLVLVEVASGLSRPVHVAAPAGDDRLFIVEKKGTVRILRDGRVEPTPFLDIGDLVTGGNEQGLLSIAFHPSFDQNGLFFIDYTDGSGDTRVVRYAVGADPDRADAGSASLVLEVPQPRSNHNGGHILFGPDGMLYVALGDGGGAGDTFHTGQDRTSLLGTILRLDVDSGTPYAIPPDNPYAGHASFRPEIWAWGLRNPWRLDIDVATGLLYIADVGQNRIEEVDMAPLGAGGLNYGWSLMEGTECFGGGSCDSSGLEPPVLEYGHDQGCSVTGGVVYRGEAIPDLQGHYVYSDYCSDWIRSFRWMSGELTDVTEWGATASRVTSYGRDGFGEVYLTTDGGQVYRIEAAP
jgi:glucose/arabinose dehydrogenase